MKPVVLLLAVYALACDTAPNNKLPAVDSAAPAPADTTRITDNSKVKDTTRLGGVWFLQPVLASDTATGKVPRIEFNLDSKRFSGNTGCNNMSGTFVYTDSTLTLNQPVLTKMNCVGYNERAFLESLLRANHYRFDNGMLVLLFNQTELSRWTRKVMPKPVVNKT
jgi:heat shock protein HslJ